VGDGGMVVLVVVAGAQVLRLLPMPQILGHMRTLMLVHLGVMAVDIRLQTQVLADRQVDRQPPRQPGSTADDLGRLYTS
jgi:hypothetical protein